MSSASARGTIWSFSPMITTAGASTRTQHLRAIGSLGHRALSPRDGRARVIRDVRLDRGYESLASGTLRANQVLRDLARCRVLRCALDRVGKVAPALCLVAAVRGGPGADQSKSSHGGGVAFRNREGDVAAHRAANPHRSLVTRDLAHRGHRGVGDEFQRRILVGHRHVAYPRDVKGNDVALDGLRVRERT